MCQHRRESDGDDSDEIFGDDQGFSRRHREIFIEFTDAHTLDDLESFLDDTNLVNAMVDVVFEDARIGGDFAEVIEQNPENGVVDSRSLRTHS